MKRSGFSQGDEPMSQRAEAADIKGFTSAQCQMSQDEPMSQDSQTYDEDGSNGSTDQTGSFAGDPAETLDTQALTENGSSAHLNSRNNLDESGKNETRRFIYSGMKVVQDEV